MEACGAGLLYFKELAEADFLRIRPARLLCHELNVATAALKSSDLAYCDFADLHCLGSGAGTRP